MVDFILAIGIVAVVVTLLVTVLVLWGLARSFRSLRRQAGRATRRIQEHIPQQALGSQTWWLAGRLDRVEEKAGYACACAAPTFLADEVRGLAAELRAASAAVRLQVQAASRLAGDLKVREADRLEAAVVDLERGANQLVVTATHLGGLHSSREGVSSGEHVRRRAAALDSAVDELEALEHPDPARALAPPPLADPLAADLRMTTWTERRR
ncbi:MAG: hypothetical protein K1X95_00730 [Acidimicrobiia bacterium]|nr:hypothetical protein [Acidimicrobiia bacterium]